jgi:hypothetical protein
VDFFRVNPFCSAVVPIMWYFVRIMDGIPLRNDSFESETCF